MNCFLKNFPSLMNQSCQCFLFFCSSQVTIVRQVFPVYNLVIFVSNCFFFLLFIFWRVCVCVDVWVLVLFFRLLTHLRQASTSVFPSFFTRKCPSRHLSHLSPVVLFLQSTQMASEGLVPFRRGCKQHS